MHATRTPLQMWFWAAYLVTTHHPGISAVQLQRQLGIARYETAWLILHKLRRAMVAPEREKLSGAVEVDDLYIGGIEKGRRGGRSSQSTKAIVVAAIEKRGAGSGRLRLVVVPDLTAGSLCGVVTDLVDFDAAVFTDGWQGYRHLSVLGYEHQRASQRQMPDGQWLLPRVHRAISNLKAWLLGTHRGVSSEHLQVYLNEFVFRHNRRRTPMAAFQTLLGLGAQHPGVTYTQLTEQPADDSTEPTGYAGVPLSGAPA